MTLLLPSRERTCQVRKQASYRLGGDAVVRLVGIVDEALRALDRLGDIRDDAIPPAPDLVAEQAESDR